MATWERTVLPWIVSVDRSLVTPGRGCFAWCTPSKWSRHINFYTNQETRKPTRDAASGFCYPKWSHVLLAPSFSATTSSCLMQFFHTGPLCKAQSWPLSIYWMCLGVIDLWEVCADRAFGFVSYFNTGLNRDDCLAMGSSIKYLWVANCFSLIRTWGAFSCRIKGFKTSALLRLFQPY